MIISKSLLDILPKTYILDSKELSYPLPIVRDPEDDEYHIDYLDYLNVYISRGLVAKVKKIAEGIVENHHTANKDEHKKKWRWLKEYHNSKINDYRSKHYTDRKLCDFMQCKHPPEIEYDQLMILDDCFG